MKLLKEISKGLLLGLVVWGIIRYHSDEKARGEIDSIRRVVGLVNQVLKNLDQTDDPTLKGVDPTPYHS